MRKYSWLLKDIPFKLVIFRTFARPSYKFAYRGLSGSKFSFAANFSHAFYFRSGYMWPFTRKRAITAFRFRKEFRLEPVWKPFERNLHSFERPGSSVQKKLHPFERLDHPFDRNVQPFEWLAHPFGKSIHPFERLAHPFDKNVQPFERLTHPFVKNIQPFKRLAQPFAGTSIRSNDLSMRQHTSGCLFLFAYSRVLDDVTYGKKSPPLTWTVWTAAWVNYKWKLRYCKFL